MLNQDEASEESVDGSKVGFLSHFHLLLLSRARMPLVRNVLKPHALPGIEQKTKNLTTWLTESRLASAPSILEAHFLLQTEGLGSGCSLQLEQPLCCFCSLGEFTAPLLIFQKLSVRLFILMFG